MTYRAPELGNFEGDLTAENYARMDFMLNNTPWENMYKNVDTTTDTGIETDHKLMLGTI